MVKQDVIEVIRKYILSLTEIDISINKVILFGSQLKGDSDDWSDIDIAVISEDFGKDILNERILVSRIAYHIDPRLDVHPFSLEEFENESWKTIIHEIKLNGIEIAA